MKIAETIYQEAFEEMNAWNVVKQLVITLIVGFVIDRLSLSPFQGFWFLMAGLGYIAYLGLLITKVSAQHKRDERMIEEAKQVSFEEKQTQLNNLQSVIKRKANELKREATAIKEKANALQNIANDNETLGKERQLLANKLQTLGKELATAKDLEQTQKQTHAKEVQALLTELSIAQKETVSLKKKLAGIEREEQERSFKKSVKATWSSSSKNEETMNDKFGIGKWEEYVNR